MSAFDFAVRSKKPGAFLLEGILTSSWHSMIDKRIKFMFCGIKGDTGQHVQCEHCKVLLGHQCVPDGKLSLEHLNIRHFNIGITYLCLVCFDICQSFHHLVAHLLMHSHEELSGIGVSDSLLLKFVRQEHPIDPDVSKLVCSRCVRKDDVKLVELLAKHQTKNDGFTLELLKTLG